MTTYSVTLQVKPSADYDYISSGAYFKTFTVTAETEKEAWGQTRGLGRVVKIEESEEALKPVKTRKTWQQRWEDLTENYDYIINNRDEFVCDYIVLLTQKKAQRERLSDSAYQLKKVGKKYQLFYMGVAQFKPSDADTTYSWFCRLPLNKFAQEANHYRSEVYDTVNA